MAQLALALPDPPPVPHEWLTVGARRWCLGCDVWQRRRRGEDWPPVLAGCPRSTPYAWREDQQKRTALDGVHTPVNRGRND